MIPLLQTKTADTAHTGIFASNTRPLSRFLGGDEARCGQCGHRVTGSQCGHGVTEDFWVWSQGHRRIFDVVTSRLIWTPLKLVHPGTNFSEISGPAVKNLFPLYWPATRRKSVTTKDIREFTVAYLDK